MVTMKNGNLRSSGRCSKCHLMMTKKLACNLSETFYRGTSAYADHVDADLLSYIHLKTKLDDAVISAAKSGKDIVLTGNPGDGKTHIIRVLKEQLERLATPVIVELDASTLSNEEIYSRWAQAKGQAIHRL